MPSGLVVLGGEYPDNTETDKVVALWGSRVNMETDGDTLKGGPRVRYSNDGGRTWSDNVVQLRNDVSKNQWDTGYIVTTQRTDGRILAIYYWQTDKLNQPHIAYTVFDPNVEHVSPISTSSQTLRNSKLKCSSNSPRPGPNGKPT